MRRRLNLLYVGPGFHHGGMEQSVLSLFRGLDAERFRPMACGVEHTGAIGGEIEAAGFEVVKLGLVRRPIPTVLALINLMRQRQIDIVHAANFYCGWVTRLAALTARVPVRILHEHQLYDTKRWQRVVVNRTLDRITDGVIAVSQVVKQQLLAWYKYRDSKVEVIYNGVDTHLFSPTDSKVEAKQRLGLNGHRPVVGMLCRLHPSKGHRYFFEAVERIRSRVDAQWVVVGTGAEDHVQHIMKEAEDRGVRQEIRFVGMKRNVAEWLRAFDLYVHPTLQEGGPPLSVLEAMAVACPVVVSDCPSILEGVEHGRSGLVVGRRDSVALAGAIGSLLANADLRRQLGAEARRRVEASFSIQRYVKATAEYYEMLWSNRRRGR